jgi:hypothetical protein
MIASGNTVGVQPTLEAGLALLQTQRDLMITGNTDRLADINARLAEWVASLSQGLAEPDGSPLTESSAAVSAVRSNLVINASLAARVASSSMRALEVLLPAASGTYGADGRARAPAVWLRALCA